MKTHKLMTLMMLVLWRAFSADAMVLDSKHSTTRAVYANNHGSCARSSEQPRTPYEESIERGRCEPFAQSVGRIKIKTASSSKFSGTGTIIAPNAILTAAHVVMECSRAGAKCSFEGESKDSIYALKISQVFISPLYQESSTDSQTPGAVSQGLGDIAIAILEKPIKSLPTILKIRDQQELADSVKVLAFAASYNEMTDNATGLRDKGQPKRHIMVTSLEKEGDFFANSFLVPADSLVQLNSMSSEDPVLFPNQFFYEPSTMPFLQGMLQPGDSGGPLLARYQNGGEQIIGIAREGRLFQYAPDVLALKSIWEPVYPHLEWIKNILQKN